MLVAGTGTSHHDTGAMTTKVMDGIFAFPGHEGAQPPRRCLDCNKMAASSLRVIIGATHGDASGVWRCSRSCCQRIIYVIPNSSA